MAQIFSEPGKTTRKTIKMTIEDPQLDFENARVAAKEKALAINRNAMQLAWFDNKKGEGFPNYDCGAADRPPWEIFADSRGANLIIDINDSAFVFYYLTM